MNGPADFERPAEPLPPYQAARLATLLDALGGVPISDTERRSLTPHVSILGQGGAWQRRAGPPVPPCSRRRSRGACGLRPVPSRRTTTQKGEPRVHCTR